MHKFRNNHAIYRNVEPPIKAKRIIDKLFFGLSFFMVFPGLLILGQNASLFIFIALFFYLIYSGKNLQFNRLLQVFAALFGVGAIVSVVNTSDAYSQDATSRALSVLPNFLYWSFLIIFLISYRRLIDLKVIYKGVYWGIIATITYYAFLKSIIIYIPLFRNISSNSFAFLLVCFSPIAIYHQQQKNKKAAVILLIILVSILLLDGRRAGVFLVLTGGLAVLFANRITFSKIIFAIIIIIGIVFSTYSGYVEKLIFQSSERIHEFIYDFDRVQKTDQSYLIRIAQIKKGMAIFRDFPYTGIGLNNFSSYQGEITSDFEGSRYVIYKKNINEFSAHNSYIALLAEGGLLLLVPFLLILFVCIVYFIYNFMKIPDKFKPIFIGLIVMSFHLYFITAIVNVYAWFLIGLASAVVHTKKIK